jgi:ankyrin repeat protein
MLVKDFLTSGADVTSKDIKGNTAVHYAAKSGSADALESLSGFKE